VKESLSKKSNSNFDLIFQTYQPMKAKTFFKTWKKFVSENITDPNIWLFNQAKTRSVAFLGEHGSSHSESPLGKYFKENIKNHLYVKDNGGVDLSIFKESSFQGTHNLYDPKNEKYTQIEIADCPVFYDIILEMENDPRKCYTNMIKLTTLRAKLKVLITYNWDKEADYDYKFVYKTLRNNFRKIIKQANKSCKEVNTEYLLIVGQHSEKAQDWKFFILKP
jgi:hypothetical protein